MRYFELRCFVVSMVAVLLVCSSAPARAELIVADDFSYPDGPLDGKNGGSAGSGSSWDGAYSGGGWNVSGGQATGGIGSLYSERRFSTDFSGSPTAPLYFSARFGASAGSDTLVVGQYLMDDAWNGFQYGIHNWDGEGLQPFVYGWGPTGETSSKFGSYTAGTEVLIVGKVEFNVVDGYKELIQIWVDPTNVETSTQSTSIVVSIGWTTPTRADADSYISSGSSGPPGFSFTDDVRVGDTWADVGPVPEPSTLALLATGLIGLLCYAWRKRK